MPVMQYYIIDNIKIKNLLLINIYIIMKGRERKKKSAREEIIMSVQIVAFVGTIYRRSSNRHARVLRKRNPPHCLVHKEESKKRDSDERNYFSPGEEERERRGAQRETEGKEWRSRASRTKKRTRR